MTDESRSYLFERPAEVRAEHSRHKLALNWRMVFSGVFFGSYEQPPGILFAPTCLQAQSRWRRFLHPALSSSLIQFQAVADRVEPAVVENGDAPL